VPDNREQRRDAVRGETLIAMGGAKLRAAWTVNNTGTRVVCVSGDVERPGYFEIELAK